MTTTGIIIAVVCSVVFLALGIVIGIVYRKKVAEAAIGSAEEKAKQIIDEAAKTAETKKKEALIEAKEEILRQKTEADRDIKERRKEVSRLESRAVAKEEALDKKYESLEKKEETLNKKIRENTELTDEIEKIKLAQKEKLEQIAGLTAEEAKAELLEKIEAEVRHEEAAKIREIEAQFKEEAETKAKNIISLAIQKCAADHVAEATVSVVALPNDEMKGRIIGREGRNIRTIETLTGVDLIIDDTPEAITLSSFDPVRREVARLTLEKLISDGRIHPTRIEETVEKSKREVDVAIKQAGERAVFETGIHGINSELVRLLGAYPEVQASEETVIIISLFHDLCKANTYQVEKRNRKDANGKWESYDAYTSDEKFHYGGHGSKSVFILQNYMKITAEEAVAVNAHMSCWDGNTTVGAVYEQFPLAWILHVADEAATYIQEGKKNEG